MARKRQLRNTESSAAQSANNAGTTAAANAEEAVRPLLSATANVVTAQAALQSALDQLDAIAQEAHVYTQQQKQAELMQADTLEMITSTTTTSASTAQLHKRPRSEEVDATVAADKKSALPAASLISSRLDVFAVTSALQYRILSSTVAAFGLQLLPSLEDITKRVTLAVLTPALSTAEAWEMLATLCTTYRAGMAHAVNEVLESLLREPGVLLVDAAQLVPRWYAETYIHVLPEAACAANTATAALGSLLTFAEDQKMRVTDSATSSSSFAHLARMHTDRVARKLRALVDVIYASGDYLPPATLQQFALRHVMEVVDGGVLPCYASATELGHENVAAFKTAASKTNNNATSGEYVKASSSVTQALRWRVPPAWHVVCLQLLEAFILTIRPAVPTQLLVTAAKVTDVVLSRLHRGVPVLSNDVTASPPSCAAADSNKHSDNSGSGMKHQRNFLAIPLPVSHAVNAAVVRLGHVVHLLRHPVVLAPYQPPQLTLEKAKRRVWMVDTGTPATAATTVDSDIFASATAPAAATTKKIEKPSSPAVAQAEDPIPYAGIPHRSAAVEAPVTAAAPPSRTLVRVPSVEQKEVEAKPATPAPATTLAVREDEEEDDEIPEIVFDD